MDQHDPEYEATPEDFERMDRVHLLVTAHPKEFQAAASAIDVEYSPANIAHRAEEQRIRREKSAGIVKSNTPPKYPLLWRLMMEGEIPEYQHEVSGEEWNAPSIRWSALLHTLINYKLPVSLPAANWEFAASTIFVYWISCDERAGSGPTLSEFQRWPWTTDDFCGRSDVRSSIRDWPRFNRGVDVAIAVARQRGLVPGCSVPALPKSAALPSAVELRAELANLNATQQEILKALAKAVNGGRGLTLDQLADILRASNRSTVERGITAMEKLGLELPNHANTAGYSLRGRSLMLGMELLRIEAETTRDRR